jgi:hypothetical protein
MEIEFSAKPFKLNVRSSVGAKRPVFVNREPVNVALYRGVVRRVVSGLVVENARLRRDVRRPPSSRAMWLVWVVRRALRGVDEP